MTSESILQTSFLKDFKFLSSFLQILEANALGTSCCRTGARDCRTHDEYTNRLIVLSLEIRESLPCKHETWPVVAANELEFDAR